MNKKNFIFLSMAMVLVLSLYFVIATAIADNITFTDVSGTPDDTHAVASADNDGKFVINWTNDTIPTSPIGNWTVTVWVNESLFNVTDNANTTGTNFSWGYTWSNATQGNYTFAFSPLFDDDTRGANSTNVSIYVDSTVPVVDWDDSGYTNATAKKNTSLLTLNISVADTLSGFADSYCVFDINGTNETVAVSDDWCNTTQLNLTGLIDGNKTIDIWVNDSANNVGVNLSTFVVWVDTTAPVATFTCNPSTIGNGATTTCTCTGTDTGGVGVNDSLTTAAVTITSGSTFGIFTTGTSNCTITDYAGNTHNATGTYTVASDSATDSTSSTSKTPMRWTGTFVINEEQFSEGNTKQVAVNKRLRFKVKNINHHLGVLELTDTTAKIEVSSTPQEATLSVGDTRKFDVSEDGYYDLVVTLNSILGGKADLTIKSISELITVESEIGEQEKEEVAGGEEIIQEDSIFKKWWFWLIIVLIVVGAKVSYNYKKNKE